MPWTYYSTYVPTVYTVTRSGNRTYESVATDTNYNSYSNVSSSFSEQHHGSYESSGTSVYGSSRTYDEVALPTSLVPFPDGDTYAENYVTVVRHAGYTATYGTTYSAGGSTTVGTVVTLSNSTASTTTQHSVAPATINTSTMITGSATMARSTVYAAGTSTQSSSYFPSTTTEISTSTAAGSTATFSTTYEDDPETYTQTSTATDTITFTSSNYTVTDGSVMTSSYVSMRATSTVLTDTSSRTSAGLFSSTLTRTAYTAELQMIIEAREHEALWSFTGYSTTPGFISDVADVFTKTTVTRTLASTALDWAQFSSLFLTTSTTYSATFVTGTTGATYTRSTSYSVTVTRASFSAGLPIAGTSSQTVRLVSTTTASVMLEATAGSTQGIASGISTTTQATSRTLVSLVTYTATTASAPDATSTAELVSIVTSTATASSTANVAFGLPFFQGSAHSFSRSIVSFGTQLFTETYAAGGTFSTLTLATLVGGIGSMSRTHWQSSGGWQDHTAIGDAGAIYTGLTAGPASVYYPFTAYGRRGGIAALVFYPGRTTAETAGTTYSYEWSGSVLSYTSASAASASGAGTVSVSGTAQSTVHQANATRLDSGFGGTGRRYSVGGLGGDASTVVHGIGPGAVRRTRYDSTSSTVDTTAYSVRETYKLSVAEAGELHSAVMMTRSETNTRNFDQLLGTTTSYSRHPLS